MENINQKPEGRKAEMEKGVAEIAKENFNRWAESLITKDPKAVASLYSEDVTFLPTVSPDFKRGSSEAEGYFAHFLAKNPEGQVKDEAIQPLGDDFYLHSGMYDFTLDGDGGRTRV